MTCTKALENFIATQLNRREQFANGGGQIDLATLQANQGTAAVWAVLIMTVVMYILLMTVGKWIWNTAVVELVSVARPADSVFQIIGLAILVKLVLY